MSSPAPITAPALAGGANRVNAVALDAQIRRLRSVKGLAKDAAPFVAKALKSEIDAQIARGEGPDGTPWALTDEGRRPLQNAAKAVSVTAVGSVVVARVEGHEAFHHRGQTRGNVRRPIIPTGTLTEPFTRAIKHVVTERYAALLGGANGR
jgi:hypothetical protein